MDSSDTEIEFDKVIEILSLELKKKSKVSKEELKILQEEFIKSICELIYNDIYEKANKDGVLDITSPILNKLPYINKYVNQIFEKIKDKLENTKILISYNILKNIDIPPYIKKIILTYHEEGNDRKFDNFILKDYQDKLFNLEKLYLIKFDGTIGNLNNLPNLRELHFCINNDDDDNYFNFRFSKEDSLSNLPNLNLLSLPYEFNDFDSLFSNDNLMKHLKVIKIGNLSLRNAINYRSVLEKLDKIYIDPDSKKRLEGISFKLNLNSTGMPNFVEKDDPNDYYLPDDW